MKLLVVLNPKAAGGRASHMSEELKATLQARGIEANFISPAAPGDAQSQIANRLLGNFDGVVAAGGDGTTFEVLNGLMSHDFADRPPLGLIPLGTGNAFSRDLGLEPGNWRQAVDVICAGEPRLVDVGFAKWRDGSCYFVNILGLGFVVQAALAAEKFKWLGSAAYSIGTIFAALKASSDELSLVVDGEEYEERSLLLEIANSRYTGTNYLIAPDARIDDGYLDIVKVRRLSRPRLLRLFPTIFSGRHIEYEEVEVRKARQVDIRAPIGAQLLVDGDLRGEAPVTITCRPAAIRIFSN